MLSIFSQNTVDSPYPSFSTYNSSVANTPRPTSIYNVSSSHHLRHNSSVHNNKGEERRQVGWSLGRENNCCHRNISEFQNFVHSSYTCETLTNFPTAHHTHSLLAGTQGYGPENCLPCRHYGPPHDVVEWWLSDTGAEAEGQDESTFWV